MPHNELSELRKQLGFSQRIAAQRAQAGGVVVSQTAICLMETGKCPVDGKYATWLARQKRRSWAAIDAVLPAYMLRIEQRWPVDEYRKKCIDIDC